MNNHPTITFLFTDIEGSTQLWEKHPESMQVALARHDEMLRQAIERHHGNVFKTVGDAFCAAFANASDALSAALEAQRALHTEAWGEAVIKVRMGIHSGAAELRDNDYFGPPLNRVARLMSAGYGGQILLSAITHELVHNSLPPGTDLRDMGECSLKDLIRPEHIYQVVTSDLQTDFPALKTLEAFRTNLPIQLTSFIGREQEISTVKSLMAEHRLTTLTGAGGTGKTRLSLQVAADLLDSFPDGVWFIELAPLADPAFIPQTILTTLGLREESGRSVLESLSQYLHTKKVLLILDNCEHLVEAAAQLAETLLHHCVNLRLLVSSREALGIAGEKACYVRSLSTPKTNVLPTIENARKYEAINLFVDRAQIVSSAFALTPSNVSAIAQICTRLDGIPLAIELAAARVKILKPEQIAERLNDRFRLLTGGNRTALPRHQTLRAMIDWSYDLLPEAERVLLRRLSVFTGGWTLEAAEQVAATKDEERSRAETQVETKDGFLHPFDILDLLTQLINKSLVTVDAEDEASETRYRLLETVRQYAREKLAETSEGMTIRNAHLQYFISLAEMAEPEIFGPQAVEWVKRLEADFDNIRAALEWSMKDDPQVGLRLASTLVWFWEESNYASDGANWLEQFLALPENHADKILRAKALEIQGRLLIFGNTSRPKAYPALQESLALFQQAADKQGIASSLLYFGVVNFHRGDIVEGKRMVFDSLALHRELNDKFSMIRALSYLGELIDTNDYQRALSYFEEALALCREIGYMSATARTLSSMGWRATKHGDCELAHAWLEESCTLSKRLRRDTITVLNLLNLGHLAFQENNFTEAQAYYEEYLLTSRQTKEFIGGSTGWVIAKLAYIALRQKNYAQARNLFQQSRTLFDEYGAKIGTIYIIEGLANLAVLQGQYEGAAKILAWADVSRIAVDDLRPPVEQADVDRDLASIRAHLNDDIFAEAQAAGRIMSMDEAIKLALESTHD
jgi:predicted ATPase/class 3 adenylate cyclase